MVVIIMSAIKIVCPYVISDGSGVFYKLLSPSRRLTITLQGSSLKPRGYDLYNWRIVRDFIGRLYIFISKKTAFIEHIL